MSRWPIKAILDVCDLVNTRVRSFAGMRQYVSTGDLDLTQVVRSEPVTYDGRPSRADLSAKEGDVLFARMQATNKVVLIKREMQQCLWSTGFAALRPKSCTNSKWLQYWLRSRPFIERKDALCTGATQKAIRNDGIRELTIPIPPLPDQERLVQILDEAETLCRLRAEADELTDKVIASFYNNLFIHNSARLSWKVHAIETLTNKIGGAIRTGPFGSQLLHSEFVNEGIPVLGIDNVVENEFRWTTARCIPRKKFEKFLMFQVFPGDVMVTIMGTVGKCCVAPDDLPLCMSTKHLCVITPDRDLIHPRYLWAAFLYDSDVRQQTRAVGGGAIMEGWNSTIIRQLKLHIPPIALQHEFASHVAEIRTLQTVQATSRSRIDDLFQSLMNRAFQGEL